MGGTEDDDRPVGNRGAKFANPPAIVALGELGELCSTHNFYSLRLGRVQKETFKKC